MLGRRRLELLGLRRRARAPDPPAGPCLRRSSGSRRSWQAQRALWHQHAQRAAGRLPEPAPPGNGEAWEWVWHGVCLWGARCRSTWVPTRVGRGRGGQMARGFRQLSELLWASGNSRPGGHAAGPCGRRVVRGDFFWADAGCAKDLKRLGAAVDAAYLNLPASFPYQSPSKRALSLFLKDTLGFEDIQPPRGTGHPSQTQAGLISQCKPWWRVPTCLALHAAACCTATRSASLPRPPSLPCAHFPPHCPSQQSFKVLWTLCSQS